MRAQGPRTLELGTLDQPQNPKDTLSAKPSIAGSAENIRNTPIESVNIVIRAKLEYY